MTSHCIVLTNVVKTVAKEKHSAAYRLFNYPRVCMVQQLFTMDEEVAKRFGTTTTGDAKLDRDMRNAWVHVRLTAPDMCALIARGAGITFQNEASATQVYVDLVEHLRNWVAAFEIDPNLDDAPLDDMRQFDELAAMIFPYTSTTLMKREDDGGYGAFMARLKRAGRMSVDWRRGAAAGNGAVTRQIYRPLSDTIAEWVFKRKRV